MTMTVTRTRHRALRGIAAFALLCLSLAGSAHADKLVDFKQAAGNKYCDAIPYSSERSRCKSLSSTKDRVCRDFRCPLDDFKKKVETLATRRKNLEEARKRKNESAAKDLEKTIAGLMKELERIKDDAKKKSKQAEACGDARVAVQKHFEDVRKKVQGEREEELKPYVTKLVDHYIEEKKRHDTPIREVQQARNKCEQIQQIRY